MPATLTFPVTEVSHRYENQNQFAVTPTVQNGGSSATFDSGRIVMAWGGGGDGSGTLSVEYVHFPDSPGFTDVQDQVETSRLVVALGFDLDTSGIPDAAILQNLGGLAGIGVIRCTSSFSGEETDIAVICEGEFPGLVAGVTVGHVKADGLVIQGIFDSWGTTFIDISDVHLELTVHLILTAVTPPSSGTRGNDTVVLTGGPFDGTEAVTFGGELALSVECPDPFTLICVTPPHPVGFVDVVVTNATYGSAIYSFFNYYLMESAPTIVNVAPLASGAVPIVVMTDATVTRGYNNGAISYWWRQVSGPEQVLIEDPDHVNTALVFQVFTVGTYVFELTVTTEDAVFVVPSGMTIELSTQPPRVKSGRLHGN